MTQDHLDGLFRYSKRVEIASEAAPRRMPAMPKLFESCLSQRWENHASLQVVEADRLPLLAAKTGPESAFPLRMR
jgi:hypothetical protein